MKTNFVFNLSSSKLRRASTNIFLRSIAELARMALYLNSAHRSLSRDSRFDNQIILMQIKVLDAFSYLGTFRCKPLKFPAS